MTTFSSATPDTPDRFVNKSYSLGLQLANNASHASGSLNFAGVLNGTLTATTAHITNTYTSPTTQQLTLGNNIYTVHIDDFPMLPAPGSWIVVSLHAQISVSGAEPMPVPDPVPSGVGSPLAQNTPEPSSLVLAVLGLCLLSLILLGKAAIALRPRTR